MSHDFIPHSSSDIYITYTTIFRENTNTHTQCSLKSRQNKKGRHPRRRMPGETAEDGRRG